MAVLVEFYKFAFFLWNLKQVGKKNIKLKSKLTEHNLANPVNWPTIKLNNKKSDRKSVNSM